MKYLRKGLAILRPLVISISTEAMINTDPIKAVIVSGSPINVIPIVMAVRGSKAPSIATLAESIRVNERTSVTLLMVVGTSPNNTNDISERLSPIFCTPPVVKEEYNIRKSIAMKKI